jgi:hypothetical protein
MPFSEYEAPNMDLSDINETEENDTEDDLDNE